MSKLLRYAPLALVLTLMVLTILSVKGIHGFMWSHAGSAGGHLFSVALNSFQTPLFMHASRVFADGTLDAYNYPAPLFFWLQAIVTSFGDTFQSRLSLAYYLSATISALTLATLYFTLQHFNIRRSIAALTVAALCSTQLYVTFRGFITYDILSPLLSLLFLLTITRLQLAPTRRHILQFLCVGFIAILSSYYAVTLILVYLGTHILLTWRRSGFRAASTTWPMVCACLLGGFTVFLIAALTLQEYLATGTFSSWQGTLQRQSNLNGSTISMFDSLLGNAIKLTTHWLLALVIAGVLLLARQLASQKSQSPAAKATLTALCNAALFVTAGTTLFITLTPGWSTVHPFAFFGYAAPVAVAIALVLSALTTPALLLFGAVLCISAPVQLYLGYLRDKALSQQTTDLLTIADKIYPAGTTFHYATSAEPACGPYTAGHIFYLGAYPNRWLQPMGTPVTTSPSIPYVTIDCTNAGMVFSPSSGTSPIMIKF